MGRLTLGPTVIVELSRTVLGRSPSCVQSSLHAVGIHLPEVPYDLYGRGSGQCAGRALPDMLRAASRAGRGTFVGQAPFEVTCCARNSETNWIVWLAAGFAGLWVIVIALLLILRTPGKPAPTVAVSPPIPVTQPVTQPLFNVNAPAPPTLPPSSAPVVVAATKSIPQLRIVPKAAAVSDEDVVLSIKKGVEFLLSNFDEQQGELNTTMTSSESQRDGLSALCIDALLHCSQSMRDDRISPGSPQMRKMLMLKAMPMVANQNPAAPVTYSRSLRAAALLVYDRVEDRAAVPTCSGCSVHITKRVCDVYVRPNAPPNAPTIVRKDAHGAGQFSWDNSNSQYGLLEIGAARRPACQSRREPPGGSALDQVPESRRHVGLPAGAWIISRNDRRGHRGTERHARLS